MMTAKKITEQDRIYEFDRIMENRIPDEFRTWLIDNGFFRQAASTKFHGCYEGGLYDHSAAVTRNLLMLTDKLNLSWRREMSPYIIGMLHDLCKIDQYIRTEKGFRFNRDAELKGHGEKSTILVSRFMELTKEELFCIRYHMGAYEEDDWDGFDRAIRKYPNVLYTHTADMVASKVDER